MPRKQRSGGDQDKLRNYQPIYLEFSDREREEIKNGASGGDYDFASDLEERIADGWKISLSFSTAWNNYVASFTPKEVSGYPGGAVYIFRHTDYDRLRQVFRYFFAVMVEQDDKRLHGQVDDTAW